MKQIAKRILSAALSASMVLSLIPAGIAYAAESDGFTLFDGTAVASIYVDSDQIGKTEYSQVVRAAGDLKNDINMVTGVAPQMTADPSSVNGGAIIVGTVGQSDYLNILIASGKLNVSEIENQWEAFTIKLVDENIVIAGSDKRGTIYGIYTLSEMIGVSPWYWWGDVPVERKNSVVLSKSELERTEMPDVKYRGIFINDEENFQEWSKKFENSTDSPGSPNPQTYAKVFELMLRLKANILWPAMHQQSTAFNAKVNPLTNLPYNAEMADRYGVIMSASHCEMLLRNNETEWEPWCNANKDKYNIQKINGNWKDGYDYTVNPEAMNAYWEERVATNYRFDNMYMLGLRAVHDAAINCANLADKSYKGKAGVVKKAVEAQLKILEKYEKKLSEETGRPQKFAKCFCPYKEASEYYKYDLSLPDDTYIIWADDNHGYVRQQCTEQELNKYAGAGVYYHVSYYDGDRVRSYLWVASTPLALIYEEMKKAYDAGSDDVWILNVGDIKPSELPMEFFLRMGWDIDRYTLETVPEYIREMGRRDFGFNDTQADELADIITKYYQYSISKRPEYHLAKVGTEYSMTNYGDEAQIHINRMVDLCDRADALAEILPQNKKDSFWQLVQYMIRASRYSLEKGVYQQRNQMYAAQDRFGSINAAADASWAAYQQVLADLKTYNQVISGGKWDKIINPYTTKQGLPTIVGEPKPLTRVGSENAVDGIGSVCEGQTIGGEKVTLRFDRLSDDSRFIDLFSKGTKAYEWTVTTPDYIKLETADGKELAKTAKDGESVYAGSVAVEERLWAAIDWSRAPEGRATAEIVVSDKYGFEKKYPAEINNSKLDPEADKAAGDIGYYETNGEVSIEAEHFSSSKAVGNQEWRVIKGVGRSGDSIKVFPDVFAQSPRIDGDFANSSPYVEYKIYFQNTGDYKGIYYRLPFLNEGADINGVGRTCRAAVQFDNGSVDLIRGTSVTDTDGWNNGILNQIERLEIPVSINVTTPGWHTLRIYKSDSGMGFDKITLQNKSYGVLSSHLGQPESFNTIAGYQKPARSVITPLAADEIIYPEPETKGTYLFDFSANMSEFAEGYMSVDNTARVSTVKGYEWNADTFANVKAYTRSTEKTSQRDKGFVYGNAPAEFTVRVTQPGRYIVGAAIGDRQTGGVAVKNMSIRANGETVLSGINASAGGVTEHMFTVDVGEDKQIRLEFDGDAWIVNALEIGVYGEPKTNGGTQMFYPDSSNAINIEVESALEQSEFAWSEASSDKKVEWVKAYGESGCAMTTSVNKGASFADTSASAHKGPKMHFKADFGATGTYNVWAYVKSASADDDSLLTSFDGKTASVINDVGDTAGKFKWVKAASFSVSEAGVHTVSLWAREDGMVVDKIVIAKRAGAPAGIGGEVTRGAVKTALGAAIKSAQACTGSYTAASKQAFTAALNAANEVFANKTALQSEVDAAAKALSDSIKNLVAVTGGNDNGSVNKPADSKKPIQQVKKPARVKKFTVKKKGKKVTFTIKKAKKSYKTLIQFKVGKGRFKKLVLTSKTKYTKKFKKKGTYVFRAYSYIGKNAVSKKARTSKKIKIK